MAGRAATVRRSDVARWRPEVADRLTDTEAYLTTSKEAQEIEDETGSWIHAYLHRKEGDLGNAGYWYRRAKKPTAHDPLED